MSEPGVPTPASDVTGLPSAPAEGTSEGEPAVEGVAATAIARDGLADGETDNRVPPTSTF